MTDKKLEELTPDQFHGMMDGMISDDFDRVTATEFFGALAGMDEAEAEPELIELTAHIEGGELVLDQPAPVPVEGNEIRLDNKRLVIKLRQRAEIR